MGIQLVFARAGCGKSYYVNDNIRKRLFEKKKSVLVVPEQYTHIAEHKLLNEVGSISPETAEVTSFNKMIKRTERNNGIDNVLTPMAKNIIMSDVLSYTDLEYFADAKETEGFGEVCLNLVGEFKKYCVLPEQLKTVVDGTENERLKLKMKDVAKIYEEYVKRVSEKGFDSDDGASYLANAIVSDEDFADTYFYFDEFSSFIPQEMAIIKSIAKKCDEVVITLCTDGDLDNALFAPVSETVRKIQNMCKEEHIKFKNPIVLKGNKKHKGELAFAEENLLPYPKSKYDDDCEKISLFSASDPWAEVENAARRIISLCRDGGYRFKDIAVVCSQIGTYAPFIKSVFKKYNISCFIDDKTPVVNHRIVEFVLNILDIYLNDYDSEHIFEFLKSGVCRAEGDGVYMLENYCRRTNMRKNSWISDEKWNNLLERNEATEEEIANLCSIRDEFMKPLAHFHDSIKGRHTVEHMCKSFYKYLESIGLSSYIGELLKTFEKSNDVERGEEYEKIWNIIVSAFDELVSVLGDKTVNVRQFRSLLRTAFSGYSIGLIPTSLDEVFVGNVTRSRMDGVKVLFVLGANDGVFPSPVPDNEIINDGDKEVLSQLGIELAADTKTRAFFEDFFMYSVFTVPSEMLFISFSRADSSYQTLRPSFVLSDFKRAFPGLIVETDVLEDTSDFGQMEYITQIIPSREKMTEKLTSYKMGEYVSDVWFDVYGYFCDNYDFGTKLDKYCSYSNVAEDIDKDVADEFFGDEIYTTVSRLQRYRACRFSYFAEYMLKLKDVETYDIKSIDTGSFVHSVIENICRGLGKDGYTFKTVTDDYIYEKIDFFIDGYTEEIIQKRSYISKRQLYLIKRLRGAIFKGISLIRNHIASSKFEPLGFEMKFNDDNIGCIEFDLGGGKKAKITGVIDRSDVYHGEDGDYVRVIDYKTGSKEFSFTDIFHGLDIQLFVYLNALVASNDKYKYAGALYFKIDDPIYSADSRYDEEKTDSKISGELKMKGLILGEEELLAATDGETALAAKKATYRNFVDLDIHLKKIINQLCNEMVSGKIKISPCAKTGFTPCSYCPYKSVCGFDVRKKDNRYENLYSVKEKEIWGMIGGEEDVDR